MEDTNYSCESIWIKILDKNKTNIFIGVFYRSPTATAAETDAIINQIKTYSRFKSVILGDFNYPDINWKLNEAVGNSQIFVDVIEDCFLWQHIQMPTRGKNILDLVLSTEQHMISEVEISCRISNSDHNIISFQMNCSISDNRDQNIKYRYDKANYEEISKEIEDVKWESEFKSLSVNEKWDYYSIFLLQSEINMFQN